MKLSVPEGMNYHALNAMVYMQACAKLSISDCMKDYDFGVFVLDLITFYPAEWEFFCRAIKRGETK